MTNTVANELVGAAWPSVQPGTDPVLYGHVLLDPLGAFPVSYTHLTLPTKA